MDDFFYYGKNLSVNDHNQTTTTSGCHSSIWCYFVIIIFLGPICSILFMVLIYNKIRLTKIVPLDILIRENLVSVNKEDYQIMRCSICFENIRFSQQAILKCQHGFHFSCLKEWFKESQTCPICRQDFKVIVRND